MIHASEISDMIELDGLKERIDNLSARIIAIRDSL